jgi:D-sedoheptulose 7-phosphate isomerase
MSTSSTGSPARRIAADHLHKLTSALDRMDLDAIERVFQRLRKARDTGATVYIAGNGGSAATATHWANDLGKATKRSGGKPIRVLCLNDNMSWLTALANDEGYDRVFSGQLENFARPDDLLVVISTSGNSQNLVSAVELAKDRGTATIGFLGFDGGALKNMVDDLVWVPTEIGAYELAEDSHMTLCHILTKCLAQGPNNTGNSN